MTKTLFSIVLYWIISLSTNLVGQVTTIDSLIAAGKELRSTNPKEAIAIFDKAQVLSVQEDYGFGEGYAYFLKIKLNMYSTVYDEQVHELERYTQKARGTEHEKLSAELDHIRGTIAANNGLLDTGMVYLNRSIKWFLDKNQKELTGLSYLELAKIHLKRNDKESAKLALQSVYDYSKDSKPMRKYITLYNTLEIALAAKDYEGYNKYLSECSDIAKSFKMFEVDDGGHDITKLILGIKDDKLEEKLQKALVFQKEQNRTSLVIATNDALASIQSEKGNYEVAYQYLQDNKNYVSNISQRAFYYKNIYENRKRAQDNEAALQFLEQYRLTQDSMLLEKSQANVDRLQVELQTVEKDYALRIKTRQRNYLLGTLALLSLVGIFFLWSLKRRNELNKKIYKQQKSIDTQRIAQLEKDKKIERTEALLEGQEKERARIAQDLHDGLGGLLTTVKAHYNNIQSKVKDLQENKVSNRVETMIDEACTEVRRISHDLMPNILSLDGLTSAVESIAIELRTAHKLHVDLDIRDVKKFDNKTLEIFVYRITQELCNNITKYARAQNVTIQLYQYDKELVLLIEDDGVGFSLEEQMNKGGLGLKSTISRVEYLNGKIDFDSALGKGTSITINIPTK
jgi:signal transduction histidine kinase